MTAITADAVVCKYRGRKAARVLDGQPHAGERFMLRVSRGDDAAIGRRVRVAIEPSHTHAQIVGPPSLANAPIPLVLTPQELALVCSALDSHVYWQLSDEEYRDSGYVQEHGSNDPENAAEIAIATELMDRLAAMQPVEPEGSARG